MSLTVLSSDLKNVEFAPFLRLQFKKDNELRIVSKILSTKKTFPDYKSMLSFLESLLSGGELKRILTSAFLRGAINLDQNEELTSGLLKLLNTFSSMSEEDCLFVTKSDGIDFNDASKIIYIPENWDCYEEGSDGMCGTDFLGICKGDRELALEVYFLCEGQHPATVLDEICREREKRCLMRFVFPSGKSHLSNDVLEIESASRRM